MSSGTTPRERALCRTAMAWLLREVGFRVQAIEWAGARDSSAPNVEGVLHTSEGALLVEHTLLESFSGEKTKDARFIRLAEVLERVTWHHVPVPVDVQFDLDYDRGLANSREADRLAAATVRALAEIAPTLTEPGAIARIEVDGVRVVVIRRRQGRRPVVARRILPWDDLDQSMALKAVLLERLRAKRRKFEGRTGRRALVIETQSILLDLGLVADAVLASNAELAPFDDVLIIETGGLAADQPWFLHAAKVGGLLRDDPRLWEFPEIAPVLEDHALRP